MKKDIKLGIKAVMPIAISYAPISMTFGILSKGIDLSIIETISFSAFVFAGSSQFMAIGLLSLNVGIFSIILSTFLLNFRHLLMSMYVSTRMKKENSSWFPLIAFGIIDEIFALISVKKGDLSKEYCLTMEFIAYFSWVLFTAVGYFIGEILPYSLKESMIMGIYGIFIAFLIPQMKNSMSITITVIISGAINALVKGVPFISDSWSLILAIIIGASMGSLLLEEKKEVLIEV